MAETRISKIRHRQGNFSDLPVLDPGELGYAKDVRRLFIGNDTVSVGTGNGVLTSFTVPLALSKPCNRKVFVDGVEENAANYSISGTTLTFASPPTGAITVGFNSEVKIANDVTLPSEISLSANGSSADIYVLFAKDVDHPDYGVKKHGGTTAFIVENSFEGFSVGKKEDKLGIRSSDTCTLVLEDCKVPVENVIKESGKGFPIAMNALDNSRIGIAAQALGIAQGALEAAVRYAHEREAFGKPIAYHQTIGNYLADMATQTDAARLMVYRAAWAKEQHYHNGGPRHTKEASMAKLFAGDTAMWVAERAVQVLGGYGYTTDFPVERFFRDAKITQIYEGTQEVQRIVINRSLGN